MVFAELHWTPGLIEQAENRAHRIGQPNSVNIHYLVAQGTLDDILWRTINKKVGIVSSTLDGFRDKLSAKHTKLDEARMCPACESTISQCTCERVVDEDVKGLHDANEVIKFAREQLTPSSSPNHGKSVTGCSVPTCTRLAKLLWRQQKQAKPYSSAIEANRGLELLTVYLCQRRLFFRWLVLNVGDGSLMYLQARHRTFPCIA